MKCRQGVQGITQKEKHKKSSSQRRSRSTGRKGQIEQIEYECQQIDKRPIMKALNVSSRHLQDSAAHPLTHLITKPLLSGRDDAPRQSAASTLRRGFPGHHFTHQDARFAARDATKTTRANARTHRSANVVIRPYNINTDVRQQRRPGKNKALRSTALHCIAQSARTKRALATTNRVPPGLSRRPKEA